MLINVLAFLFYEGLVSCFLSCFFGGWGEEGKKPVRLDFKTYPSLNSSMYDGYMQSERNLSAFYTEERRKVLIAQYVIAVRFLGMI